MHSVTVFAICMYLSDLSTQSDFMCRMLLPQCHKSALTTCELGLLDPFGHLVHNDCVSAMFKVIFLIKSNKKCKLHQ